MLTVVAETADCMLLRLKDNGGLIKPSAGVIAIVQKIEMKLRIPVGSEAPVHSISQLGLKLESSILADIKQFF